MELVETRRDPLGPGEVRVEVRAAALSFLDLLGSLRDSESLGETRLGLECAGVVTEVGPGVRDLRKGDEVFGMCSAAVATECVTKARLLVPKPAGISFEEARAAQVASIPAGRLGRPEEVGATCAFLCSNLAGYISGQNVQLDGGAYGGLI